MGIVSRTRAVAERSSNSKAVKSYTWIFIMYVCVWVGVLMVGGSYVEWSEEVSPSERRGWECQEYRKDQWNPGKWLAKPSILLLPRKNRKIFSAASHTYYIVKYYVCITQPTYKKKCWLCVCLSICVSVYVCVLLSALSFSLSFHFTRPTSEVLRRADAVRNWITVSHISAEEGSSKGNRTPEF